MPLEITWFIMFAFLLIVNLEFIFLGRYLSASQDIFHNKTILTYLLGAVAYFGISFLVFIPFIIIKAQLPYFASIIVIKDFFLIIFLFIKREKLILFHTNFYFYLFLLIAAIAIPFFYKYNIEKYWSLKPLEGETIYPFWNLWKSSIRSLMQIERSNFESFFLNPLSSMIIYASVASLYSEISQIKRLPTQFLSFLTTLIIIFAFNLNIKLSDLLFLGFVEFLFLSMFYLIIYSRRRYGSLFGVVAFVVWSINHSTFWLILFSGIITILIYMYLKKPKPSIFTIQITSFLIILSTFKFGEISNWISILLTSIGIILYLSIFIFGQGIQLNKKAINFINRFSWIIILAILYITALTILIIEIKHAKSFWNNSVIQIPFNNQITLILFNAIFYVVFSITLIINLYWKYMKLKITKFKLIILMVGFFLIFVTNPIIQIIFLKALGEIEYTNISTMIFSVLTIGLLAHFFNSVGKLKIFKNATSF